MNSSWSNWISDLTKRINCNIYYQLQKKENNIRSIIQRSNCTFYKLTSIFSLPSLQPRDEKHFSWVPLEERFSMKNTSTLAHRIPALSFSLTISWCIYIYFHVSKSGSDISVDRRNIRSDRSRQMIYLNRSGNSVKIKISGSEVGLNVILRLLVSMKTKKREQRLLRG